MALAKNEELVPYWISFPQDPHLPFGIGVTATSEKDAFALIRDQGIESWFEGAQEISVQAGVTINDLDQGHVVPNMGPMQFRGVWYPAANIGFGSPRGGEYNPTK